MTLPDYGVVFVYPPKKWTPTGLLSRWIAKMEKRRIKNKHGPYTHCAFRFKDTALEATINDNKDSAVDTADLKEKYAHRGYDTYENSAVAAAYSAAKQAARAGVHPDWSKFSIASILWLMGVGWLAEKGDGRIARWLLRRGKNIKGLFCAEFVSEALTAYGGQDLYVEVNPDRIPRLLQIDESVFKSRVEVINAFRLSLASGATGSALALQGVALSPTDADGAWTDFKSLSAQPDLAPAGLGAGDPLRRVKVGFRPGQLPPFLVALSDLANSRELTFLDHKDPE